ncbi:MAG: cation diffusion facilitator family transporter [Candidatus Saganbacteria bacterium]|nr:cation diffusion facilitator family transporter [Candidatus Saganbacteria bacterium]
MTTAAIENKQIFAAKLSIVGWVLVILVSLAGGLITDSITLLLDAAQGIVTLAVAFMVHAALRKLGKPPDDTYHFGYDKYEPLTSAVQEIMIILVCVVSVNFAVQDFFHADVIDHYNTALIAAFLGGIVSLIWAFWIRRLAHSSNSAVLKTSSNIWFLDSVLSFGIFGGFLLGLLLNQMGYSNLMPYTDPIMAIVLALIFIISPIRPLRADFLDLLDAAPDMKIRGGIKKTVEQLKPESFRITHIRMRKAGKRIFLEISFLTDESLTVKEVRAMVSDFEKKLTENIPHCDIALRYKA